MARPAGDAELVQIVSSAFADAARRSGEWLVCHPGCTQCCVGSFTINALDVERLREGMQLLRESDHARFQQVRERAREYVARNGAAFPGDAQTGALGES